MLLARESQGALLLEDLEAIARVPRGRSLAGHLLDSLLDALMPPRCVGCRALGALLCSRCLHQVKPVPSWLCHRCGRPLVDPGRCTICALSDPPVGTVRSAALYGKPLNVAIQRFKYHGQVGLAEPLGGLMVACWRAQPEEVDLVVPVPLHERRQRQRGYNQARLLAEVFCRWIGLPLLAPWVLRRSVDTPQQVALDARERQRNVAGAFSWHGPQLGAARVLLVDDVMTTGSTLDACGEVLRSMGAGQVWALTVARVFQGDTGAAAGLGDYAASPRGA